MENEITVGIGATIRIWTDCLACTVVKIEREGKRITVQRDKAIREDKNGMSECQKYVYERDSQGTYYVFTLRKNGEYVQSGCKMGGGYRVSFGNRREYYDYSF